MKQPIPPPVPTPDDLADEDVAFGHLRSVIGNWLVMEQLNDTPPMVAASKLFSVLFDVIKVDVPLIGTRTALLMTYAASFGEDMSIEERAATMKLLDQIVQAQRKISGKSSLILPGAGDA